MNSAKAPGVSGKRAEIGVGARRRSLREAEERLSPSDGFAPASRLFGFALLAGIFRLLGKNPSLVIFWVQECGS
jgi:hypothetical protein